MIWAGVLSGFLFVMTGMAIRGLFGSEGQGSFDVMSLAPAILAGGVGALIGWIKVRRMRGGSPPWSKDEWLRLTNQLWLWAPFAGIAALWCSFVVSVGSVPSFWIVASMSFIGIWLCGWIYISVAITRDRTTR